MKQFSVGILLFDDVDALDFTGPYEVFNMSTYKDEDVRKLFMNQLDLKEKPFLVNTISENGESIKVHNGLIVQPDFSFQNAPDFDVIVVPGGPLGAIITVQENQSIINWIASYGKEKLVISVCTGAFFLAKAGLLQERSATTNKAALSFLEKSYPDINVVKEVKYVDQGNVVTAAGISAGINMTLHVVKKLFDESMSNRTANTIEFSTDI
ncbi:AraC family transcriptional regulator [Sporosarcina sp. P2]|uniref:DJ-1/PfpI family protein n=1 Tax=Sporosarcina sp. P2 TaxID=2048251 RepID=UPI000C164C3B|nr:DJ-1/PfpI family protein [Sporosarcina sp. P2]PID03760.1 AraC family transcriptional regulator [Sporosarcina sp. P2]